MPLRPDEIKPGPQTTEFWMTLAANVVGVLALTGIITPDEIEPWSQVGGGLLVSIVTLVYTYGRSNVKAQALRANAGS